MTGPALIDALAASGTGPWKLAAARDLLKARPDAPVADVIAALKSGGAKAGTLAKCEELLGIKLAGDDGEHARPVFPVRAPLGGVKIGGKQYVPGQIVPEDVLAAATADEVHDLCRESTALGVQPIKEPKKAKESAESK